MNKNLVNYKCGPIPNFWLPEINPYKKSHLNHDTTSEGKINIVQEGLNFGIYASDNYSVSLVGSPNTLERHIDEQIRKGFSENKILFIESNKIVYNSLIIKAKSIGFDCNNIIYDDMLNFILKTDKIIDHIDFDACNVFSSYEGLLINAASIKNKNTTIWLTSSFRFTEYMRPQIEKLSDRLKLPRMSRWQSNKKLYMEKYNISEQKDYYLVKNPNATLPYNMIIEHILHRFLPDYDSKIIPYTGVSKMLSIFIKPKI